MKTTLYKAKNKRRKRKHGFLARKRSKSGRKILLNRRRKKRTKLTV